jgi:TPR repeat protein
MSLLAVNQTGNACCHRIHGQNAHARSTSTRLPFAISWISLLTLLLVSGKGLAVPTSDAALPDQLRVPMPQGQSMEFRAVIVSSEHTELELGSTEQSRFVDAMRRETITGSFHRKGQKGTEWLYYIGIHEVTEQQWSSILGTEDERQNGILSKKPKRGLPKPEIEFFAYKFNDWLKNKQGAVPVLPDRRPLVRLPTLAEWEFAARGGGAVPPDRFYARYPYDEAELDKFEWNGGIHSANGVVQDVVLRQPNPLGLHDMVGNVREIIRDLYTIDEKDLGYTVMGSDCRDTPLAFAIKRTPRSSADPPGERVGFRLVLASELIIDPAARKQREQEAFAGRSQPRPPVDDTRNRPRPDDDESRLTELERRAANDNAEAMVELAIRLENAPATRSRACTLFLSAARTGDAEKAWDGAEKLLRAEASTTKTAAATRELADFLRERNRHRWERINAERRSGNPVDQLMAVACDQDREAIQLLERAADLGSNPARMKLITALWEGDGTPCDPVRAERLLEQLPADTRPSGTNTLAMKERMRKEGDEVRSLLRNTPQVDGATIERLRGALKLHALQRLEYASSTASSIFSPNNPETRGAEESSRTSLAALWKRLLDEHPCDSDLHVELGYCYQNGIGVKKNYRTAFEHFQRAQNLGDPAGTFFAAMEFRRRADDDGRKDGLRCLDAAVQQSFPLACRHLAGAYLTGDLTKKGNDFQKDPAKAEELFQRALSGGILSAAGQLGYIYFDKGSHAQREHAIRLWNEGAEKGAVRCKNYLRDPAVVRFLQQLRESSRSNPK